MQAGRGNFNPDSGWQVEADDVDIVVRKISVGQPHRAISLTGSPCPTVACNGPGTVAHDLARPCSTTALLRIDHLSGRIFVAAEVTSTIEGPHAACFRQSDHSRYASPTVRASASHTSLNRTCPAGLPQSDRRASGNAASRYNRSLHARGCIAHLHQVRSGVSRRSLRVEAVPDSSARAR